MVNRVPDGGRGGVRRRGLSLRGALLLIWLLASFGVMFFAYDLQQVVAGWPFSFWFGAQGR